MEELLSYFEQWEARIKGLVSRDTVNWEHEMHLLEGNLDDIACGNPLMQRIADHLVQSASHWCTACELRH